MFLSVLTPELPVDEQTVPAAFSLFWKCIDYCYSVILNFFSVFDINFVTFFISFIAAAALFRLVFRPIVGSSDTAFRKKASDNYDSFKNDLKDGYDSLK